MPTSDGGGFLHISADEEASARLLRGVGPDKPPSSPAIPARRRTGFDWGEGSAVQPTMTAAERREIIRKARLTSAVPDRFSSPLTARDPAPVSYDVTDADRLAAAPDAPAAVPPEPDVPVGALPGEYVQPYNPLPGAPLVPAGPREKPAWRRDRDARIVALYRSGSSTAEIAKTIECGQGTIYAALRDAGVTVGERPTHRGPVDAHRPVRTGYEYDPDVVELVARLYVEEGLSQEKIGARIGRSQIWVSTLMRRVGIERRRSGARPKPVEIPPPLPEVEGSRAVVEELAAFPWQAVYDQLTALTRLVVESADAIGVKVR